jgi:hypothetical protein
MLVEVEEQVKVHQGLLEQEDLVVVETVLIVEPLQAEHKILVGVVEVQEIVQVAPVVPVSSSSHTHHKYLKTSNVHRTTTSYGTIHQT